MSAAMIAGVYSERIGVALRERFGEQRFAAKLIARMADTSDRAARKWLAGLCGPQPEALIVLMAREPAVAAAVQDLVERQQLIDAEHAAWLERRRGDAR